MDQDIISTKSTGSIRVLFVDLPPLLVELLQNTLATEPDLEIAGSTDGRALLKSDPSDADIVLLGVKSAEPPAELCEQIFQQFPYLKIMTISLFNNDGNGYWLNIERYPVGRLETSNLNSHFQHLFNLKPKLKRSE